MKKSTCGFLEACLLLSCAALGFAQQPPGPPKVLRIYREEVKPGRNPAHEKVEAAWARANRAGKSPAHYIGMTYVSGPNEAWFIEGHDSLASAERADQYIEHTPALKAETDRLSQQDGELLSGLRSVIAEHREDLSYRTGVTIGQMRYFYLTTLRVRTGHNDDFLEAIKLIRTAHEKANVPEHWAVFEVMLGMPRPTYLMFQPLKSLAEVDAFPQTHGQAYRDATGDSGRKKLAELFSSGILTAETNIFAFNPKMSYVTDTTAAADPDFWTPKPKAAAKAPAEGAKAAKKPAAKPAAKP